MIISHVRIALSQQFFRKWPLNLVKTAFGYFDENYFDESKSEGPGLNQSHNQTGSLYTMFSDRL